MRSVATLVLVPTLGLAAGPLGAPAQTLHGFEAGVASVMGEARLAQAGYHGTFHALRSLGIEYAVALAPQFLVHGVLLTGQDLDVGVGIGVGGPLILTARAGGSVLFAASTGGAAAAPGYNAGVGVLVRLSPRAALRLEFISRRFPAEYDDIRVSSVTLGFVILGAAPPSAR